MANRIKYLIFNFIGLEKLRNTDVVSTINIDFSQNSTKNERLAQNDTVSDPSRSMFAQCLTNNRGRGKGRGSVSPWYWICLISIIGQENLEKLIIN